MRFSLSASALFFIYSAAAVAAAPSSTSSKAKAPTPTVKVAAPMSSATDNRRTVCTVTINSDDEKKAFKANLPAKDFKFVELTEIGQSSSGAKNDSWFRKACEQKINCDVLIVSGHFAGSFFGSSKLELGLDEMERASCTNSCSGILNSPKETFLFGCNTLATKEKDTRTPEEYTAAQMHSDPTMSLATAQRNTQGRYGAMGASFKERMRRVFSGVPHLYGFSSVSPSGANIKPYVEKYLKQTPNYLDHIKKIEAEGLVNKVITANNGISRINNLSLAKSMAIFAYAECSGIMPDTTDAELRAQVCQLYNPRLSIAQTAQAAADMLRGPNSLTFLPSVLNFIRENETEIDRDPTARAALRSLLAEKALWTKTDAMIADPKENPTIKVDLLRMNLALGRIDKPAFETKARVALAAKLRELDASTVELVCDLQKDQGLRIPVSAADIDPRKLETNAGVSAFACLRSNDPEITRQVLRTFSVMKNPTAITYGLQGMLSLPSYEEERIEAAREHTISGNPDVAAAALTTLATITEGEERKDSLEKFSGLPERSQITALEALHRSGVKNEELARDIILSLKNPGSDSYGARSQAVASITPDQSPVWSELSRTLSQQDATSAATGAMYLKDLEHPPAAMAPWALESMKTKSEHLPWFSSLLAKTNLSREQVSKIADQIVADPSSEFSASLRYIVRNQRNAEFTETQRRALDGPVDAVTCYPAGGGTTCRLKRQN